MVVKKIKEVGVITEGDYKITYHFALLPKRIGSEIIWMERYKKAFVFREKERYVFLNGHFYNVGVHGDWELIAEQRIQK